MQLLHQCGLVVSHLPSHHDTGNGP
jgi:hypothetical protein